MPTLLDLPRETRDSIYSYLLGSPASAINVAGKMGAPVPLDEQRIKGRLTAGDSVEHMETSLLRVNKAISEEAIEHLYTRNTFHPSRLLSHFVTWLKLLTPTNRRLIRRLELQQTICMPLMVDNTIAWQELRDLIEGHGDLEPMQLNSITIHVPLDALIYIPNPFLALRIRMSSDGQFLWPTVQFFVQLFMDGKKTPKPPKTIKQVRLVLPSLGNRGIAEHQQPLLKDLAGPDAVDLEELEAVRILRCPRVPEEDEAAEAQVLEKMMNKENRPNSEYVRQGWAKYYGKSTRAQRPRLDFHVRWEPGKEGEVLMFE